MNLPEELHYTKDHEWARRGADGKVVVGITDYAQDALGDITYLELPNVDDHVSAGTPCGVIESVKTFSDIYAPVSGRVSEVNDALADTEALVNESPYEDGWLFAIDPDNPNDWDDLLTAESYAAILED